MWKVPAKAAAGSTALVAQPRQPGQQHVDLELGALGRRLGRRPAPAPAAASSRLRTAGAQPATSTVARARCAALGRRQVTSPVGVDRRRPRRRCSDRRAGRRPPLRASPSVTRAHAADGHVPVAGAAADEVVEEADVLAQVRPRRATAKVPMRASVATMPRTVSSRERRLAASRPAVASTSASPQLVVTDQRPHVAAADRSGSRTVGKTRWASVGHAPVEVAATRRTRSAPTRSAPRTPPRVAAGVPLSTSRPVGRAPPAPGCRRSSAGGRAARRGRGR